MRILVRAEEENRRILVKAMLRTVSVMHIPVDDEHAAQTVLFLNVARRDSYVVEKTKTHRPVGFRMVTGWPHGAKRMLNVAAHDRINGRQRPARGQIGRLQRTRRHRRIAV